MGDVAMTVPVLRALVLQHPEVQLTVVSRPFFKPFFNGIPNVDFFAVDLNKRHKGFAGLLRLYADLRKLNVDAVADLHNVLRSKVVRNLFALSGKKVSATDKGREAKKALTRFENKIFAPVKPMVERHCATFAELGFTIDLTNPKFPKRANLSEKIITVTGTKSEKWIGIAPFAQYESKVYPFDLMKKVIDALASDPSLKVLLFGGGEKEIQLLNQLRNSHSNVVVLAGKLKLQQELEVISNLDVMLSMDSGNAHLAAMLGVKVITLWGATHPFAGFKPFHQPDDFCITADRNEYPLLPTSVYGNKKVDGYGDVMRTILPETVVTKIKKELE
ncbi:heptosyltransferase [Flavobacterium saliperosum S13]|uniref:ADP-heptose:LPS heptosyltransferase n=3 Tax=Flavobacterium saliperosum TaxID=329186 RepID=A0A1G4W3K6_9FLAO|nr:heptosyltransferase [Flavobacterium saliperosum S13]SCX16156.1 ADP-heptose:LPS heptosyltransferase [Flavobacterium saliperosum]